MPAGAETAGRGESLTAVDVLPILLVDDRPENLRTLEAVLGPLGHPLLQASSGAEALRLLLEHDVPTIVFAPEVQRGRVPGLPLARRSFFGLVMSCFSILESMPVHLSERQSMAMVLSRNDSEARTAAWPPGASRELSRS